MKRKMKRYVHAQEALQKKKDEDLDVNDGVDRTSQDTGIGSEGTPIMSIHRKNGPGLMESGLIG